MRRALHLSVFVCCAALCLSAATALAQDAPVILAGAQLARVVPPGFYYLGQSAPTQMRNAAAARFGANRYVIAGLVDTSGYSADVRGSYEGFLIADSAMRVQDGALNVGAYGFGFTNDGKLNIYDVGGHAVLTVATEHDTHLRRPRRLYSGRKYVLLTAK